MSADSDARHHSGVLAPAALEPASAAHGPGGAPNEFVCRFEAGS